MNEARRFIRYIIPGFLFVTLMFFMLWIVLPEWTVSILKEVFIKDDNPLAIIIGSIFTSGALGYLFATFHHWCHWNICFDREVINHSTQISSLIERGLIKPCPDKCKCNDDKCEALITISTLWFERLGRDNPIGNSENRVERYGDLAHAAGAARIAALFAVIWTIIICMLYGGEWSPTTNNIIRYVLMLFFGSAIIYLFNDAWRKTGKIYQHLNDRILDHALEKEHLEKQKKGTGENGT